MFDIYSEYLKKVVIIIKEDVCIVSFFFSLSLFLNSSIFWVSKFLVIRRIIDLELWINFVCVVIVRGI